jgi:crotonobetainyl-CoA:carnitine CoA-transferase CaiB-like acyl-CoA transferase
VLGQHTEEILRGLLKKTDAEIAKLKADGTV